MGKKLVIEEDDLFRLSYPTSKETILKYCISLGDSLRPKLEEAFDEGFNSCETWDIRTKNYVDKEQGVYVDKCFTIAKIIKSLEDE